MRKTRPIALPEDHEESSVQAPQQELVMASDEDLRDFLEFNSVRLTENVTLREPQLCPVRPAPLPPTHSLPITPSHTILPESPSEERPRQLGRRAEMQPRVVAINAESAGNPQIIVSHQRPQSAPARVPSTSEVSSAVTSRNPSPTSSTISSSASSSMASATPQR